METEAMRLPSIEQFYEGVATSRSYGQIENIIVQRKVAEALLPFDTFLIHGSTIAYENQAYMFTAPSHTGKREDRLCYNALLLLYRAVRILRYLLLPDPDSIHWKPAFPGRNTHQFLLSLSYTTSYNKLFPTVLIKT